MKLERIALLATLAACNVDEPVYSTERVCVDGMKEVAWQFGDNEEKFEVNGQVLLKFWYASYPGENEIGDPCSTELDTWDQVYGGQEAFWDDQRADVSEYVCDQAANFTRDYSNTIVDLHFVDGELYEIETLDSVFLFQDVAYDDVPIGYEPIHTNATFNDIDFECNI